MSLVCALLGLLLLAVHLIAPDNGKARRVVASAPAPTTPPPTSAETTAVAAPTSTRPPTTATRAPSPRPAPRAPAPYSSAGLARAVWDIPGSGFTRGDPVVALTFDDGPDPRWTPQVMGVLDRYGVQGSFFAVGYMAARYRDLVGREAAAGNGVGNHTWDHVDLRRTADYGHQVDDTSRLLADVAGHAIGCIRPPYGAIDGPSRAKLGQRGLTVVLWDVDPGDYTRPGVDAIVSRVLSAVRPGSIVGLHDGGGDRSQTVAALPRIIEGLQERGLRPVALCNAAPPVATASTTAPPAEPTTTVTSEPDPSTTTTTTAPQSTTTTTAAP